MKQLLNSVLIFLLMVSVNNAGSFEKGELLFEKTLNTSAGEELSIDASSGHVQILTWDKNEVEVKIYGNDNYKDHFTFSAEKISSGVEIKVKKIDPDEHINNTDGRISVIIPSTYDTDVQTMGGHISVENELNGNIKLDTFGGHVSFEKGEGELDLSTKGGHLSVENFVGDAELNTMGGHISVDHAKGDLHVKTMGGNISLNAKDGEVDAETMGGNVKLTYTGKNKGINLSTMGGSIIVEVPGDIHADVSLNTASGHVNSDFPGTYEKKTRFEAELNGGGAILSAKSFGGNVTLRKK